MLSVLPGVACPAMLCPFRTLSKGESMAKIRSTTVRVVHGEDQFYKSTDGKGPKFRRTAHGLEIVNEFHPGHVNTLLFPWPEIISIDQQEWEDE
jgi:hypothetical protein